MPLSSDSYLAENIYVELPGSFESCEAPTVPALPRRLTDNNQRERKRSKSETITGGEFDNDKEGNEDEVRANWRNLFNGKVCASIRCFQCTEYYTVNSEIFA